MKKQNPNALKAMVPRNHRIPQDPSLSYVILNINIPNSKIRIKKPNLPSKTSLPNSNNSHYHDKSKTKKWPRYLFSKKVCSIFTKLRNKSSKINSNNKGDRSVYVSNCSGNDTKDSWLIREKKSNALELQDKRTQKMHIRLRKGVKFIKGRIKKTNGTINVCGCTTYKAESCEKVAASSSLMIMSQESLSRVPSKSIEANKELRIEQPTSKEATKQTEEDTEQNYNEDVQGLNGEELCKKRILMGVKCRPLNSSGILHYDHSGLLLPEELH